MGEDKTFNPTDYKKQFCKENYDRVVFYVKKGEKDLMKELAKEKNCSVSKLIKDALYIAFYLNLSE